jgi:hypothetical protein
MCNNQIISTIYEIMKFNKVSLEELIEFIDNQKKSYNTYSYGKTKKWGDEAVELDFIEFQQGSEEVIEEQVEEQAAKEEVTEDKFDEEEVAEKEQVAEEKSTSWVSVIKKSKNIRSENVKKPQIGKSQVMKQKVVNKQSKKNDECLVIYSVDEFIQCIKEKKKLHIDFTIDTESHCEHTFNGTICKNVKECGKIHVQRCMNNLDCKYKYCQFLHIDEMPDDESKENYMDSMDEYNQIKKNKKVYV